ncbi:helix-turn-helix domain-containing protein [Caballeronia zhejiangensis]|uniref:helix-turn-helix domain-containing protein n=1 Tax=Caballeronia zhejiangensis TaxID=871203 RepID=UPI001F5208ED|nr:helix-turn-helix transcriptional regulator [Caballeronia zhejiangensis]MCI1047793.1 helix-turn-helix transcriptional regulator [Caballeronia zhejiangensis]
MSNKSAPVSAVVTLPSVIGLILEAARKERGLSQGEIAPSVGVAVSTWSRIENGESALTVEQLAKAAQALQISSSSILRAAEEKLIDLQSRGVVISADRISEEEMKAMAARGSFLVQQGALAAMLGPVGWPIALVGALKLFFDWRKLSGPKK